MIFKLIQIPFELQPHFLDMIKSWKLAGIFIMAKHDGIQKGLIRGAKMRLGENAKGQKRERRKNSK